MLCWVLTVKQQRMPFLSITHLPWLQRHWQYIGFLIYLSYLYTYIRQTCFSDNPLTNILISLPLFKSVFECEMKVCETGRNWNNKGEETESSAIRMNTHTFLQVTMCTFQSRIISPLFVFTTQCLKLLTFKQYHKSKRAVLKNILMFSITV